MHKVRRIVENGRDNIQCACAASQMGASQIIDVWMSDELLLYNCMYPE